MNRPPYILGLSPSHAGAVALLAAALLAAALPVAPAQVVLPGTQPNENDIELARIDQCRMCHAGTPNGPADPFFSWQGGMMAQAARDPVFRAALTIANQDIPGIGEFCLRCHSPRAWLEGRSTPPDGSKLNREDLHGVTCDLCHRLVNPRGKSAARFAKKTPPGYGNAMMVADPGNVVYGPYGDGRGPMPHNTFKSDYHASSQLCATCHNVSNPLHADDPHSQPPFAYGTIERTYSEWLLSDFARGPDARSCQDCHYPAQKGPRTASRFGGQPRNHFVMHGPVGGSTWVQLATDYLWQGRDIDRKALQAARQRTAELLKTAARLELTFPDKHHLNVRIVNLTGHKLPTGYPEGRRMWVNVRFLDDAGRLIREIGRYAARPQQLLGLTFDAPTLLDPDQTRVYECLPGLSENQAARYNKKPGPSFHFVLNDIIVKDNRIPPKGFTNKAFAEHHAQPVAAEYADGQHHDDLRLEMPPGTDIVKVQLMYQSVSWEYIRFLAMENRTDQWGRKLLEAWLKTGQCPPQPIAQATRMVQ